jgi:CBS domain containing-hemolysin-like protein
MDDSEVTATILFLLLLFILVIFYGFSQGIRQLNAKDIEKDFEKTSMFKKNIINGLMNEQTRLLESAQFIITNITLFIGWYYIPFVQMSLQNSLDRYPLIIALTYMLSFLILSCIILIFVYFISKKLALKYPIHWVKILVYPVYTISLFVILLHICIEWFLC